MVSNNPIGRSRERLNDQRPRSLYNERLSFHQNTNVTIIESSSRSTRYRNKKRKIQEESSKNSEMLETPHPLETPGTSLGNFEMRHETFEDADYENLLEYVYGQIDNTVSIPIV